MSVLLKENFGKATPVGMKGLPACPHGQAGKRGQNFPC